MSYPSLGEWQVACWRSQVRSWTRREQKRRLLPAKGWRLEAVAAVAGWLAVAGAVAYAVLLATDGLSF